MGGGTHGIWLLGSFSVWHWLIILAILGVLIRPPWQR